MWVSKAVPGTRLYTSFSELPSFTAHRVRVRAINDIGTSEYSASFAFQVNTKNICRFVMSLLFPCQLS